MLGVAAFNILFDMSYMPASARVLAQSVSGCYIGLSLSKNDIRGLKQLIIPTTILIGCLMIFTAVMGLTLNLIFGLDQATAFLVAIPGGVSETSLMAPEFGAEQSTVSFIQTFRLFTVYLVFPAMIAFFAKRIKPDESVASLELEEEVPVTTLDRFLPDNMIAREIITVIIAIIGGYLGKISGLPAGTLSFAIIITILFHFNTTKAILDRKYKKHAQLLSGSLMGQSMTLAMILNIKNLILPTVVLMSGYVLANLLISFIMSRTKKIDFLSAMFASSPGGASDMALIAADLGGDSPKIAIMQIARLLSCYTIFPVWAKLLVSIFCK
ncbi:MAG: AbrB family transcriptional regulator [Erysipelotrichaceae bacterium]|nr:AbrB family transcriptional regulator [Erysipelotrichaceae bacterium]